jgi:hypothetical protein
MEITLDEAKEVYKFLQTLDTCEYLGVPPKFDEITSDDFTAISNAIYEYILIEETEEI